MRLTSEPAGPPASPPTFVGQLEGAVAGSPVPVVCPICQGALTEAQPGVFQHFRCHVGHAFSLESLVREQSEELERALWAAVRALEESSALSKRLGLSERNELKQRFQEKASTQAEQAELLQQLLLHGKMRSAQDAEMV